MAACSVYFTMANRTILDHLLPFAPKYTNGSIDMASRAKLRRGMDVIIAIGHFAVGELKSC